MIKEDNIKEETHSQQDPSDNKSFKREHYMNNLNVEQKHSMKDRLLVGVLLVVVTVPCIVIGNYIFLALALFAAMIASHEIVKAPQSIENRFHNSVYIFTYLMMFSMISRIIVKNNLMNYIDSVDKSTWIFDLSTNFFGLKASLVNIMICFGFFFVSALFDKNVTISDAFYFVVMITMVAIGFQSILFLRYAPFAYSGLLTESGKARTYYTAPDYFKYGQSILLVLYMFIGTCMNDVGAYFIGVLFGKHKMCPRISPKKTWEGFAGGLVISTVFSFGFALIMDLCKVPLLPGILDSEHFYNIIILSLLMPIFSVFGDLLFSQIKRHFHIKDFGTALRSHGGILDRLDSILITSIMMAIMIEFMSHNWNVLQ